MWIRMAFSNDDCSWGEMPTLVAAYDEYTFESWGKTPDFYLQDLEKFSNVREVEIVVDAGVIADLFKVPRVDAMAVEPVE